MSDAGKPNSFGLVSTEQSATLSRTLLLQIAEKTLSAHVLKMHLFRLVW